MHLQINIYYSSSISYSVMLPCYSDKTNVNLVFFFWLSHVYRVVTALFMVFIVIPLTNLPVILPQVDPGCSFLSQAAYSFILFFCSFSVFLSPLTERTWLALWHRAPSAADTPASPVLIYLSLSYNDLLLHWCSSYTVKKVKHVNSTLVTKMLLSSIE